MNSRIKILLLIACVFCNTDSLFAQNKVSKKDKTEIQSVCEIYLRHQYKVLVDYNAPLDSLESVLSESMTTITLIQRENFHNKGYSNVQFPVLKFRNLIIDDSTACLVGEENEEGLKINVKKVGGKWLVTGFDNHEIDQKDIDKLKEIIAGDKEERVVNDSIKFILRDFITGWNDFRRDQNTTLLKLHTTEDCFNFFRVDEQYNELSKNYRRDFGIDKVEKAWISNDTVRCSIHITGLGRTRAILLLRNDVWLVAGLDNHVFNKDDIKRKEEEIRKFKELSLFNEIIAGFNDIVEDFFKKGNQSDLKDFGTDRFIDQLEIYRRFTGTMDTSYLGVRGLSESGWPQHEFTIYGNEAYYDNYDDSIRFVLEGGIWKLDELFSGINAGTEFDKVSETYQDFRSLFFTTYSIYNTYNTAPIDNDTPVAVMVQFPEDTDILKDTVYAHRMDRYYPEREYEGGYQELYRDINTAVSKQKTSFIGVIYVEFTLDEKGGISNIHALDRIGSEEARLAEKVVGEITRWLPSEKDELMQINYVVAVKF